MTPKGEHQLMPEIQETNTLIFTQEHSGLWTVVGNLELHGGHRGEPLLPVGPRV